MQSLVGLVVALSSLLPGGSSVVAQTADTGAAAVQMLPGDDSGTASCGPGVVTWNNHRSFDARVPGSVTLQAADRDGHVFLDLSRPLTAGEKLIPLWCGDVLGDGSEALGFETFSGGAHCCFSASVVLLQADGRYLLDADFGNGGLIEPQQLDEGGPLELPATSDVFAYFDHLSFAASPFMPMVFAYDGTHYVEATRGFPDRLTAGIAQAEDDLRAAVALGIPLKTPTEFAFQSQESVALRLYGLHVLLGDADQALPRIKRQVAAPVADWLDANAASAADALAQVYTLSDACDP